MKSDLLKVSIRKNAIVIPQEWIISDADATLNQTTTVLLANVSKLGYTFSEELLQKVNSISPSNKLELFETIKEITGVNKNWTPLIKQWNIPTGEGLVEHVFTWFAHVFKSNKGTQLPCGHLIPDNTFQLERYNGCPFCGTPFEFDNLDYKAGANKMKTLVLWTEVDLKTDLLNMLTSPVALDATQVDSLTVLLQYCGFPAGVEVKMKETLMVVIDAFVTQDQADQAGVFFKNPTDVLRYLWYKHTGFLQLIEPKTIVNRMKYNSRNNFSASDNKTNVKIKALSDLKLKYNRTECKMYAAWLNALPMDIAVQCETMHSKRGMWVRVIRALRLAEYSKRKGFENLAQLLDTFYNQNYEVWQGKVNAYKLKSNADETFALLKQRPGLFARSLFSTMLWFGPDVTIQHFREVMNQVPARLIFTLNMYADVYFDKNASRTVKPLGGISVKIPVNKLLQLYGDADLTRMQALVQELSLQLIKDNWSKETNSNTAMYIDEGLFNVPIAIGDRTEQLQDLPSALMGTRFKVKGDVVRIFLQWGEGLKAQHLDMDLSCKVAYEDKYQICSYSQLVIPGCTHSGDIQSIPNYTGTAEYIDMDLNTLGVNGAKYVSFTCNAYSSGSLAPNLVVGWMNSESPMQISKSGVAYDPTAVQHQVRIKQTINKGMLFGVLDVEQREFVWLEMNFGGQVVENLNFNVVKGLLKKLDAKLKVGDLLQLKAEVQGLKLVDNAEQADEVYDMDWALDTAKVSALFME